MKRINHNLMLILILTFIILSFFIYSTKSDILFISRLNNQCEISKQRQLCGDHLICNKTTLSCKWCDNNDQCKRVHRYGMFECLPTKISLQNNIVETKKICLHKNFLPNVTTFDILALLSTFICGAIAAAGGTGGGGIFVPLLTIFGQFASTRAIPLSKAMIFGSSLFNFLVHFWRRHPFLNKPLIDYEAAMLLEPITLLGTTIGVLFNIMFPEWLVVILIVTLLGFTTIRTTRKGLKVYRKEMKELRKRGYESNPLLGNNNDDDIDKIKSDVQYEKITDDIEDSLLHDVHEKKNDEEDDESLPKPSHPLTGGEMPHENQENQKELDSVEIIDDALTLPNPSHPITKAEVDEEEDEFRKQTKMTTEKIPVELKLILLEESSTFPIPKFLVLVACWIVIFSIALIKGGAHGAPSIIGVPSCGWLYWLLFFLNFPIIMGISIGIGFVLLAKHYRKVKLGYGHHEGEIKWNLFNVSVFPSLMIIAGILASLLGIGGGMVKGPLLLELGLETEVTASTSSFMILFTSSITTAQFIILGRLPMDYGVLFFFNGFFAAAIGELIIGYPAHKYKLTFLLIFSITIVIGLATILMGGVGIYQVVLDFIDNAYMGFRPPC